MLTRLRVGGVTLAVQSQRRSPVIEPTAIERAFVARSGADIVLALEERPVPEGAPERLVFDSGGPWRVHARGRHYLYSVHESGPSAPAERGVEIDRRWRQGVLFASPSTRAHHLGSALSYPLGELLFSHHIAASGGLVLHACGVAIGGKGVLFCGPSGAGKTTMAQLWRKHHRDALILSDDRVVVRSDRGALWVYGTPWHGTGGFASPRGAPISAIFFLQHAARTVIRSLDLPTSTAQLFARTFPPLWDRRAVQTALGTCTLVAQNVPCHLLQFCPDLSAVKAVLNQISRQTQLAERTRRNGQDECTGSLAATIAE